MKKRLIISNPIKGNSLQENSASAQAVRSTRPGPKTLDKSKFQLEEKNNFNCIITIPAGAGMSYIENLTEGKCRPAGSNSTEQCQGCGRSLSTHDITFNDKKY